MLTKLWLEEVSHVAKERHSLHGAVAMVVKYEYVSCTQKRCQPLRSLILCTDDLQKRLPYASF